MSTTGKTLMATAFLEAGAGLGMAAAPALVIWMLIGVQAPSPEALIVGRVAGAALIAIALACWLARGDPGNRSQRGLLWGLLVYNAGTSIVLAFAGLMLRVDGIALWPVAFLHVAMTIFCAISLRAPARY